jgi:signal transduction histidine kinase/ligand-binding sensor domain-containing protein
MGACNSAPEAIPFPEKLSEFAQPVTQKLSFKEPIKLEWKTVKADSLVKFKDERFNLRNIPAKPLKINSYIPLAKPLKELDFKFDDIPTSPLNLNTLPTQKLKFKTALLGQPKRIKAGIPRLKDGSSENILLFGLDQGLSGTVVGSIVQDKDNILWIATDGGICRYDGEFCDVFSNQQGLSHPNTSTILIDKQEQIWVSYMFSAKGISILNTKKGLIKNITQKEGLSGDEINGIVEDRAGRIWIATNNGLSIIDPGEATISKITTKMGLSGNKVSSIFIDSRENIWITFTDKQGIDLINTQTGTIKHIAPETGIGNYGILSFSEDSQGRIWIGTFRNGILIIDAKLGKLKRMNVENGLGSNTVQTITPNKNGKMLIGFSDAGFDIFNENENTIEHLNTQQGLSNDNVSGIFIDNTGQAWIGTNGGELNIYNLDAFGFQHLGTKQGLSNKSSFIYSFTQDQQSRIWIGSGGFGVDIIDDRSNTIKNISANNFLQGNNIQNLYTDAKGRIWINSTRKIDMYDERTGTLRHYNGWSYGEIADSIGQIIFYGLSDIYILNENLGTMKFIRKKEQFNISNIQCLLHDKKGKIWVGAENGIYIFDVESGLQKQIETKGLGNFTHNLFKDKEGRIWAATAGNGLWMIDEKQETVTNFTLANGLPDMAVYTVNERNGSIYAGTGKGIAQLTPFASGDRNTVVWNIKTYGKQQGMLRIDHNPRSLLSNDGHLWFGIADVLTIMDEPVTDTLVPPVYINGISINGKVQDFVGVKQVKSGLNDSDTIWTTQLDTFYTKNNLIDAHLQNNKIRWDSISGPYNMPVNLSLPYNQNYLVFNFTGTHIHNSDKTRYSYVLEGNDKAWSDVTSKSYAEYRNLTPGKYTFKVSSTGFNNRWSKPAVFSFTINPPWWKTVWAFCFYVLIIGGLIRVYVRHHSRVLRKENLILEEKVESRTKQLKDSIETLKSTQAQLIQSEKMASLGELTAGIAHEIQNPLNFVNNFSEVSNELIDEMKDELEAGNLQQANEIASDLRQNLEKIAHHGKRADAIVKGMLQHSRSSSGVKEPTNINALADEYLRLAYHGLRAKDKSFNATMYTNFDQSIGNIDVIPQDIGRVILNLITNAFYAVNEKKRNGLINPEAVIKNTQKVYEPTVSVTTSLVPSSEGGAAVFISVSDNGNGIPQKALPKIFQPFFTTKPTGEGTGLGLSMSYEIVTKLHGGEIKVDTKENEGTVFTIILPV